MAEGLQRAVHALAQGQMVLVLDGPDRENEGDLMVAAEFASAEHINFMITQGRGLVCMPMAGDRLDALGLPPMVARRDLASPAFTVSVDARYHVGSGISAADRATTARVLLDPATTVDDLVSPGHLFPLRCAAGGLLARQGHTEAAVELAVLAGCAPAAVICEVLDQHGEPARPTELRRFAMRHGLPMVTIADLLAHRRSQPWTERAGRVVTPAVSRAAGGR